MIDRTRRPNGLSASATSDPVVDASAVHRAVAELGPPALVLTHGEGREVCVGWANAAACDLLRVHHGDSLVGRSLETIGEPARPDEHDDWRRVLCTLLGHRDVAQASARLQREDHSRTGVWLRVVRLDATAHGSAAWLVQINDSSDELAVAREAVIEAEHRFEALAGRAPVGIFVSEVGLRLGYVNAAFAGMTGRPAEYLLGTGWLDLVHASDRTELYQKAEQVLSGATAEMSIRIMTVANGQRWVHVRFAPVTTPRRSAGFIGTIEDITARRAWEEQLAYQAMHDPLTGLANRRRLIETLTVLLEGNRLHDRRFAVLFCDLDGFKAVNDTLGHDAGDRVLIEVARRLAGSARDRDLVARVAGDEFVVVLQAVETLAQAQASAQRHLAALLHPVYVGGRDVDISASVGVAFPTVTDTPESILRAADRVMYEAKSSGPGHFRLAEPPAPKPAPPPPLPFEMPWAPPAPRRGPGGEGRS